MAIKAKNSAHVKYGNRSINIDMRTAKEILNKEKPRWKTFNESYYVVKITKHESYNKISSVCNYYFVKYKIKPTRGNYNINNIEESHKITTGIFKNITKHLKKYDKIKNRTLYNIDYDNMIMG